MSLLKNKCRHARLDMTECDEHGDGNDYYVCLDCGTEFYRVCSFREDYFGPFDHNPYGTPQLDTLTPITA